MKRRNCKAEFGLILKPYTGDKNCTFFIVEDLWTFQRVSKLLWLSTSLNCGHLCHGTWVAPERTGRFVCRWNRVYLSAQVTREESGLKELPKLEFGSCVPGLDASSIQAQSKPVLTKLDATSAKVYPRVTQRQALDSPP